MLDISHELVNKLTLRIVRHPDSDSDISVAELVKGILYDRLAELYHLSANWHAFAGGGKFAASDEIVKGHSASVKCEDGAELWALYINIKDQELFRRRWVYYISQRSENADSTTLYYAKCCYDHMAGSIADVQPVSILRDSFPDTLFFSKHVQCMCGKYPLPSDVRELNHSSLPDFINMVRDETRTQPIILITCSWHLSPERLFDRMMGNAVIYWCENSGAVMRLNSMLPQSMYTQWDSVRIFMPLFAGEKTYHPSYTSEDIRRMGNEKFVSGLLQAYCRSMRSEERRAFVQISDVYQLRSKAYINTLVNQIKEKDAMITTLNKQTSDLKKTNAILQKQLSQMTPPEKSKDAEEYETLLNEAMQETDNLKQGITRLASRLCSDMGAAFQPDEKEPNAQLQELAHAIYACLQRVGARK